MTVHRENEARGRYVGRRDAPLLYAGRNENERPWSEKAADWEKRVGFARGYLARGRRDENGLRLDPVLEAHLGLGKRED